MLTYPLHKSLLVKRVNMHPQHLETCYLRLGYSLPFYGVLTILHVKVPVIRLTLNDLSLLVLGGGKHVFAHKDEQGKSGNNQDAA